MEKSNLGENKERFVRIKVLLHIKSRLLRTVRKLSTTETHLACENGIFFADSEERHVQKKFLYVKSGFE